MDLGQWLTLATYAGLLALGVVAILRARSSALAAPLAALSCISFTWNFAVWAHSVSGDWVWTYVDLATSPWTPPAAVHFVLTFVGKRRRYRLLVIATHAAFGTLSAVAATAFVTEWGRAAAQSVIWDRTFAALIVIYLGIAAFLLTRHWIEQPDPEERMRTRLVATGIVASSVMGILELLLDGHLTMPAMLIACVLMTVVAFDVRLMGNKLTGLTVIYGAALAVIAGAGYVISFAVFAGSPGPLALAILAITLCWLALLWQAARATAHDRARMERLAMLGRLSSQLAHDLKNPLAALKGAAQYLSEERARGRSIDAQHEFLALLVNESERLSRLIDRYQRLGRLESITARTSVNDLIRRVVELHRLAQRGDVTARLELDAELPECAIDADLVATALENLLRNASEAMGRGGMLTVRTERVQHPSVREAVAITVEDSGCGMNAREVEQAFDEFFSTKAGGSGLGLPLVKRVVEAHGGSVNVRSEVGRGTRIVLLLPITQPG
jgi:two-component system sensor histidine kinase HydH